MSCYYLKYGREVVEKLVLVSPVGVEDNDMSVYKRFTTDGDTVGGGGDYDDDDDYDDDYNSDEDSSDEKVNIDREYRVARDQGVDLTRELTDHLHDGEGYANGSDDDDDDTSSLISVVSGHIEHPTRVEELMKQIKTRVRPGSSSPGCGR